MTDGMIKLTEAEILSFGKMKNVRIDFADGLNVIYGSNESGKSTILLFLKAMLYGMPSRRRGGEALKERERAVPWDGNLAEGILRLTADGRRIEIRRRFGKTAARDRLDVSDADSGDPIVGYDGDNIGEYLLKIPEEVFEKTLMLSQSGAFMGGRDDEISKRLANLKSTGDEKVSAEAAVERLTELAGKLKTAKGKRLPGRIDILENRIDECIKEKYDLTTQTEQTEDVRRRCEAAKAELAETEAKISDFETEYRKSLDRERAAAARNRLKQAEECGRRIEELEKSSAFVQGAGLTEDEVNEAAKLAGEISAEDKAETIQSAVTNTGYERRAAAAFGLSAAAVIAAAAMILNGISAVLWGIIFMLGAVFAAIGIIHVKNSKDIREAERRRAADAERAEQERRDRVNARTAKLDGILSKYGVSDPSELSELYIKKAAVCERITALRAAQHDFTDGINPDEVGDETEAHAEETAEGINEKLKRLRTRQVELVSEIKVLESRMAYEVKITRIPADIDTEIESARAEIADCERQLKVIELAVSAIKEASDRWRAVFVPKLNERVGEITARICGTDSGVRVSEDYMITLAADSGIYEAEYLSCGAYEQIYFALRFALSEAVCGGGPMLLDDILTVYDDIRAQRTVEFLADNDERQTVLFTCRRSEADTAERQGAHVICI